MAPTGFVNRDYLLAFDVGDPRRGELIALCEGSWQGERSAGDLWELATDLSPAELEESLLAILCPGDRAVFYYLADSKRLFRVTVEP